MKKIIAAILSVMIYLCANAQTDITKFMGIPVDGTKAEMLAKLKTKGFTESTFNKEVLTGVFNGVDVNVYVVTNRDKVYRIMLCDVNSRDERSIQIRFNNLCHQFFENSKYAYLGDPIIPDNERISYEMAVNKKRYEATFCQHLEDSTIENIIQHKVVPELMTRYTAEQLQQPTDEIKKDMDDSYQRHILESMMKKSVWFMISPNGINYYITMYYDNEYNNAHGEDL